MLDDKPLQVAIQGRSGLGVVATGYTVNILDKGNVVKEISYADLVGKIPGLTSFIGGYKTDQIAFSADNRLLFVAGSNGRIAIVDTATLSIVSYWQVPGSTANISSLAVAGNYLYVAEGGKYDNASGAYRLMRVNIDPTGGQFMKAQQIALPGDVSGGKAPYGYFDLAVVPGAHNYLMVTAPQSRLQLTWDQDKEKQGQVFVLDLNALSGGKTGPVSVGGDAIRVLAFPDANTGRGAQYVSPAGVKYVGGKPSAVRFLLSNAFDHSRGLDAVEIPLDPKGGFAGAVKVAPIKLNGAALSQDVNRHRHLANRYRLNIQRAQGGVFYTDPTTKTEYALVADYHIAYNEADFANGGLIGKQVGGKVGIVKDPFGEKPEYLGSTTPIVEASLKDLAISADGKTLWGNINYWENVKSGVLSWNLAELIKAAEANKISGQKDPLRPIPVDRTGEVLKNKQVPEATPVKFDFGWVFGMAAAQPNTSIDAGDMRYGDIGKLDVIAAIRNYLKDPTAEIAGLNEESLSISGAGGFVTYTDSQNKKRKVSGAKPVTCPSSAIQSATDASYGDGEFGESGILFLAPTLDETQLRAGRHLGDGQINIVVSGVTVKGKDSQATRSFVITVHVKDFDNSANPVFFGDRPTDNPGYSEFKLSDDVKAQKKDAKLTQAQALDVWRVEQRLAYLGYPAFGQSNGGAVSGISAGAKPADLVEFKVDGEFGKNEEAALSAFYATTHYSTYQKNPNAPKIDPTRTSASSGNYGRQTVEASQEAIKVPKDASDPNDPADDTNLEWLNAYNAPHWMNIYKYLRLGYRNDTYGNFITNQVNIEAYATSWLGDLLRAWEVSKDAQGLTAGKIQINGLTNPILPIGGHGSGAHSVGMGLDLGIGGQYVSPEFQKATHDQAPPPNIGTGWSVANAGRFADKLPSPATGGDPDNDQAGALRNFLSVYAVTQNDLNAMTPETDSNGTWEEIPIKNGKSVRQALFGSGEQNKNQLIQNVWIGGDTKDGAAMNHYKGINSVLGRLGFTASNGLNHNSMPTHFNHFHVDLRAPVRVPMPNNLEAEATAPATDTPTVALTDLPTSYQELLVAAQTELQPQSGAFDMFVDLPPDSAAQTPVVMLVDANKTQRPVAEIRTLGVCKPMPNRPDDPSRLGRTGIAFAASAANYLSYYERKQVDYRDASVTLLQLPAHGELTEIVNGSASYKPARGFAGQDKIVALVELGGYQVKVVYFIKVQADTALIPDDEDVIRKYCGPKGDMWKISSTFTTPTLDNARLQSLLDATGINNTVTVTTADLSGGAVGQTTGSSIILDTTAANYGWFIDYTPYLNDEYLPTSNPNLWVAKEGSEAAGKMDLLSVLLHEYGHALGLEHNADSNDYMAATLQPGVRRMPSADELALMAKLVAEAKGSYDTPLPTDPITPDQPGAPLPSRNRTVRTTQTRLNQVFVVGGVVSG